MRQFFNLWVVAALAGLLLGCGSPTGKGVNRDKDKPIESTGQAK